MNQQESRPPFPPFTRETAIQKVRAAEDGWNNCNPQKVALAYEWHNDQGQWFRSYGNENWEFDTQGLMQKRYASINDVTINEEERKFHWPQGRRPDDYTSLSELSL